MILYQGRLDHFLSPNQDGLKRFLWKWQNPHFNFSTNAGIGKQQDNAHKKKPYSDQMLAELLEQEGIRISRRAITKYREAVGFPNAYVRKIE